MSTSLNALVAQPKAPIARQPTVVRPAVANKPTDGLCVVHLTSVYWPLARAGGLPGALSSESVL